MAALHTVNHKILSQTRYQLLRQIKSGSELGGGNFIRAFRCATSARPQRRE